MLRWDGVSPPGVQLRLQRRNFALLRFLRLLLLPFPSLLTDGQIWRPAGSSFNFFLHFILVFSPGLSARLLSQELDLFFCLVFSLVRSHHNAGQLLAPGSGVITASLQPQTKQVPHPHDITAKQVNIFTCSPSRQSSLFFVCL